MPQRLTVAEYSQPEQTGLFFHLDADGTLLQWNAGFEKFAGVDAVELAAKKLIDFVSVSEQEYVQQALKESYRRGHWEFRVTLIGRHGPKEYLIKILANQEMGQPGVLSGFAQVLEHNDSDRLIQRLQQQQTALLHVSRHLHLNQDDPQALFRFVTGMVSETLEVERVSIWLFNDAQDRIACVELFDSISRQHTRGMERSVKDYPVYFHVMNQACGMAIDNALIDPRAEELRDHYLQPLNIGAILETPLLLDNCMIGIMSAEFIGSPRQWNKDEQNFAFAVADYIALATETFKQQASSTTLANNAKQWMETLSAVEDVLFVVDFDGRLLRANARFYQLSGLDDTQGNNETVTDLLYPPFIIHETELQTHASKHQPMTVFLDAADPHNFVNNPVELLVRVLYDAEHNPYGVLYHYRDLTRVYEAEKNYHTTHEYIDVLIDSTSEGIIAVDLHMRCTFINNAASAILGYKADDIIGRDIHQLIQHSNAEGLPLAKQDSLVYATINNKCDVHITNTSFWTSENHCIQVQITANPVYKDEKINGAVIVFSEVGDPRAMASRMNYLVSHDALTGLVNRYTFEQRLTTAIEDAKGNNQQYVLCYMDLDQFKIVNDTCGHVVGDELIKQLSQLMSNQVRTGDTLARLGGDEFALLLHHCNIKQAQRVVNNLQSTIRAFRFKYGEQAIAVSASIGMIPINKTSRDLADVLSLVDSACFLAKEGGRNRVHVYQQHDEELALRHGEMQWVSRIRNALENNLLELYCQPIELVNPNRAGERHLEILLRMKDENGEIIPPGAFIPAAERYNLMLEVDRWVLKNTFEWMSTDIKHKRHLVCAINLSGQSIGDEGFYDYLIEQFDHYAIQPSAVCFEITETAAVANLERAIKFIKELRALGCQFSLDDFGSGMSSFTYLKNLPVDFLKIDGNLVKDIATDVVNFSMVEAINRVGYVMGIKTIAEFVENSLILEKLAQIGVDYAQGYGIARPQPLGKTCLNNRVLTSHAKMSKMRGSCAGSPSGENAENGEVAQLVRAQHS